MQSHGYDRKIVQPIRTWVVFFGGHRVVTAKGYSMRARVEYRYQGGDWFSVR